MDSHYLPCVVEPLVSSWKVEHFPYAYPIMPEGAYSRLIRLQDLNEGTLLLAVEEVLVALEESGARGESADLARILVKPPSAWALARLGLLISALLSLTCWS